MNDEARTIEQIIADEGRIVSTTSGISMWPMLRTHRDTVIISAPSGKRKVGDVVLYRIASGKCVLHRIIAVKNGSYIIRGDSLIKKELGVGDGDIFGVLSGFYRGDRFIDCNTDVGYKIYCRLWRLTYPLRFAAWKCHGAYRKIFKKEK